MTPYNIPFATYPKLTLWPYPRNFVRADKRRRMDASVSSLPVAVTQSACSNNAFVNSSLRTRTVTAFLPSVLACDGAVEKGLEAGFELVLFLPRHSVISRQAANF